MKLQMRGNFKKNHFESIILKFLDKYVTCPTCKACNSKLIENNRNLYKNCIGCGSEFCIHNLHFRDGIVPSSTHFLTKYFARSI